MAADASAPTFATRFKRPTFIGGLGMIFVGLLVVLLIKEATVSPSQFAQTTLIGLTNGAVYALIALGYTLVYGILELINFAHGDVFMLGGMFAITIGTHVFGLHHGQGPVTVLIVFATLILDHARLRLDQRDDRVHRVPAVTRSAATRAADHRDRRQLHHPGRRPRLERARTT